MGQFSVEKPALEGQFSLEINKQRARRAASPNRRSARESSMTPPSELSRPPSKAAVTFFAPTAGNENGRRLSLVMAGGAVVERAADRCKQPNPTLYQRYMPRPPAKISALPE